MEKEPPRLLGRLLLGGAVSVLPAVLWEHVGTRLTALLPASSPLRTAIYCFAVVALAEECGKFLMLRRLSWRNEAFNYRFDGIVYAVFVSMGFAVVENLLYIAGDGTWRTALLRAVTAIPGHAAFAVFMGFYYGCAKRYADAAHRCCDAALSVQCAQLYRRYLARALWLPVVLHGLYDCLLAVRQPWMSAAFIGFVAVLFLSAVRQVRTAGRHDLPV